MVLRYFGIRVTDLDKSYRFYTQLLHLKKVGGGTMYHRGRYILLEDPRSHQRLELNWYPKDSPYASEYRQGETLDHIGFKVADPESMYRKLVKAGAKSALTPKDRNGVKDTYFVEDPDGIWLEFF
jgi:catechol 2,3-dioxygenase-like lactoylglutathione lyase family enzyme